MRIIRIAAVALLALLSGCISVKSYVDPTGLKVRYEDLKRPPQPIALKVVVEFDRNGTHVPKADPTARDRVIQTLRGSGLVTPADDGAPGEIKFVVNNIADRSTAAAKGFGTGLTFGLVGSVVTDAYEMSATLTINGTTSTKSGYQGQLLSTVGNASGPPGQSPMTPNLAFGAVVEQMVLAALKDFQTEGVLVQRRASTSIRLADLETFRTEQSRDNSRTETNSE